MTNASSTSRTSALGVLVALILAAAMWQAFWFIHSEQLLAGLLYFAFQCLGAQCAVSWHLDWKPLVAQVKPARELFESPLFLVAGGAIMYAVGGLGPVLRP